jgi:RNA polymerase primary sigma factor
MSDRLLEQYMVEIDQYDLLDAAGERSLAKTIEAGKEASEELNTLRELGAVVLKGTVEVSTDSSTVSEKQLDSLVQRSQKGQEAKQEFINANLRLVVSIAKHYQDQPKLKLLDLIQEGSLGLEHAVDKFDWRKGFKFSTYGTWWIKQYINRALKRSHLIKIPVELLDDLHRFNKENPAADEKDMPKEIAKAYLVSTPSSIDATIGEDNDFSLSEVLSNGEPTPEDQVILKILFEEIERFVGNKIESFKLPHNLNMSADEWKRHKERQKEAVFIHFGFHDKGEKQPYPIVGERLGISGEAARRLVERAMEKLRANTELAEIHQYITSLSGQQG